VNRTKSLKAAIAVSRLATRYQADVHVYEIKERSPEALLAILKDAQE
jgi:hypothetical protein